MNPYLHATVEAVQGHVAVLLTIGAAWEFDEADAELIGSVCPELMCRKLKRAVAEIAAARDLSRFDPMCPM
jgi:hypothetical protein